MKSNLKQLKFSDMFAVLSILGSLVGLVFALLSLPEFRQTSASFRGFLGGIGGSIIGSLTGLVLGYYFGKLSKMRRVTVFISHSMADTEIAHKLATALRQEGLSVVLPEEQINVGDNIAAKVEEGISKSDSFIALLSSDALKSEWVQKELRIAQEKKRKILPVLVGNVPLPDSLQGVLYIKLDDSYDKAISALEEAIRRSS